MSAANANLTNTPVRYMPHNSMNQMTAIAGTTTGLTYLYDFAGRLTEEHRTKDNLATPLRAAPQH